MYFCSLQICLHFTQSFTILLDYPDTFCSEKKDNRESRQVMVLIFFKERTVLQFFAKNKYSL